MTPHIFPGLKPPTSKLFFDLQTFIAENGGRFKLAKLLEDEITPTAKSRTVERNYIFWLPKEIKFVQENYRKMTAKQLETNLGISFFRVRWMINELRKQRKVELKYNVNSKYP